MAKGIYSGNIGISIFAEEELIHQLKIEDIPPCHISDYRFEENIKNYEWELSIGLGSSILNVDLNKKIATASTLDLNLWDVVKLSNILFERTLQERGYYGVHSSAFEINGKGVLVIGDTMTGKSTIVLEALSKYGANLIGAEDTIVSSDLELVGGTKLIAPNPTSFFYFHKSLESCIKRFHKSGRPIIDAISLGVKNSSIVHLDMIVYPKITFNDILEGVELNNNTKKNILIRFLGSEIVGLEAIDKMRLPLPNLDNIDLRYKRFEVVSKISDNTPFYFFGGNPSRILESIISKL